MSRSKVTSFADLNRKLKFEIHIKAKGEKDETSKGHGCDSYFFRSDSAGMDAESEHSEALTEKKYMSYTHG